MATGEFLEMACIDCGAAVSQPCAAACASDQDVLEAYTPMTHVEMLMEAESAYEATLEPYDPYDY